MRFNRVGVLIGCALGFGIYMASVGRASGLVEGYAATAAWANTPEGKAAYQLAQAGSIESLTRCYRPDWRIEKGGGSTQTKGLGVNSRVSGSS